MSKELSRSRSHAVMWVAVAIAGGEPAVEDFLRPDEDLTKHQGAAADLHADTSSCQADGLLGTGRLSSKSMASDSTAVRFYLPCRNTLTSPAVSAAATPEVWLPLLQLSALEIAAGVCPPQLPSICLVNA